MERSGTKADKALIDRFREYTSGKSPQRVEKETNGEIPSSTAFRYQQPGYYPARMTTDTREALAAYLGNATTFRKIPRETLHGRVEELLQLFPGDEMLRRLSQHVSPTDLHRMAYDLAVRLGYSEAELTQIHEWGLQVIRDEKNGG